VDVELTKPEGLDETAWQAIDQCQQRMGTALLSGDRSLVIGAAKDLAEATARVVLGEQGDTVASGADLGPTLNRAHSALDRQPGVGLAADATIRNIAQGAKTIATQLPELRNRYGTGHGRAAAPEIADELVVVSADAAMLWSRWALRRLEALIAGRPSSLAKDLLDGEIFRRGELADRLKAANLPTLDAPDQRLLGVAVAHRAMDNTFVVQQDGVEACASDPTLDAWPPAYRAGLAEGLILDRNGYVDANPWSVRQAAMVLSADPDATEVLDQLLEKVKTAAWSYRFAESASTRSEVADAMADIATVLPSVLSQKLWSDLTAALVDRAASEQMDE